MAEAIFGRLPESKEKLWAEMAVKLNDDSDLEFTSIQDRVGEMFDATTPNGPFGSSEERQPVRICEVMRRLSKSSLKSMIRNSFSLSF